MGTSPKRGGTDPPRRQHPQINPGEPLGRGKSRIWGEPRSAWALGRESRPCRAGGKTLGKEGGREGIRLTLPRKLQRRKRSTGRPLGSIPPLPGPGKTRDHRGILPKIRIVPLWGEISACEHSRGVAAAPWMAPAVPAHPRMCQRCGTNGTESKPN